jgi:hypothetical protein
MELNEIQMRLTEAVEEVLETMCFTSVLASGEGAAPPAGEGAAPSVDGDWATAAGEEAAVPASADVTAPTDGAVPADENGCGPACTAELLFQGNPSGGFRVSVPWKLARVVGAGFLGREEMEVSDSQAEEVVCELANMICGSVLSRLESKATFQITHPQPGRPERGARFEGGGASRWFDLGDGILTVSLELQRTL